ncbi:MAG: hypothetical protein CL847_07500 [Crocinitomicaceae bacterium]|nr:hypothetical protein [Crocinitomicaceae bacterium]|tara:strand:- start:1456 stop:4680 length:3225 start_codon:yes stop_codon:yes gene_type:complete
MISKYLSFGALVAVALLLGAYTQFNITVENTYVSDYSPRVSQEELARDSEGAAEITRMLLGDIETGEINAQGLAELRRDVVKFANKQAQRQSKTTDLAWVEMGPDNVGGRTRALAIHPNNENVLYAGAVSGGLWKSVDEANTWVQVTNFPNLMVGSIAVAGNGDIYIGTGSDFDWAGGEGNSGFRGRGIWYSSDDGQTFTIVDGTDPGEFSSGAYSSTDALAAHPTNNDIVWFGSNSDFGYLENGQLNEVSLSGGPTGGVADIAIASDASYMLLAATNGRVYRISGANFDEATSIAGNGDGMLPQAGIGRTRIAISHTDPNSAFALFATPGGLFHGLHYSGNASVSGSWSECWPGGIETATPLERAQGIYDLALGIPVGQPDLAYVGGISLWRSGPNQQAEQAAAAMDIPGFPFGIHADVQDIVVAPSGTMYVTTDGGIYKSDDGGYSYTEFNHKYNVTQFYGIAHSAGPAVMGGTQDNGTLFIPTGSYFLSEQNAYEVHGGDGFDCAFSQVTASEEHTYAWFGASQNGGLVRGTISPGNVSNLGDFYDNNFTDLFTEDGDLGQFYTCVRLYEDTEDEDSQNNIILVNPYGETVTDSSFVLHTSSQNLPFTYTLSDGEELMYYDEIIRPDLLLEEPLEEDPNYFWLDPQVAIEEFTCWDDTLGSEIIDVISEIIPNLLDTTIVVDGVEYDVQIDLGNDTIWTQETQYDIVEVCDTLYFHPGDTLLDIPGRILVQDPYTTIFTLGLNGSNGIWMTRDALNFNTTPQWIRLGNAPTGSGAKSIEYVVSGESAGDVMFVSGWNGDLLRISGLKNVYDQADADEFVEIEEIISSAGSAITGVSVDPNNANHVVVTCGGYGPMANGKVRETWDALSEDPTFTNIWTAGLNNMPMYDVVINSQDESGASIIVGCEYGVFVTDNGGDNWVMANVGMSQASDFLAAPVFDLKQQWREEKNWSNPSNTGAIYAGTHGRGIFRSDDFLGADEVVDNGNDFIESLLVYPNPVIGSNVSVATEGFSGATLIEVYDLQGRVVLSERISEARSSERVVLDVSALSNGTYVVRMANNLKHLASKLVIRK